MPKRKQKTPRDPDMLARLWSDMVLSGRLLFDRRVSGSVKLIPLVMVAYIISPLDFLPDVLLPFGIIDDLGVFLLGLQLFIRNSPGDVVDQYRGSGARSAPGTQPSSMHGSAPHVIEGQYEIYEDGEYDDDDEYEYYYDDED